MAAHAEEGRISWLVGKARSAVLGDGAVSSSSDGGLTLRQAWRVAMGGCPYMESTNKPATGEMRCPFAASGQTELPPNHPMIPGMMAKAPATSGSASKLLAVANTTIANDRDAARTVQAAARGMLARHQHDREIKDAALRAALASQQPYDAEAKLAGASNLASLGRPSALATRLPTMSYMREPSTMASAPGAASAREMLLDVD